MVFTTNGQWFFIPTRNLNDYVLKDFAPVGYLIDFVLAVRLSLAEWLSDLIASRYLVVVFVLAKVLFAPVDILTDFVSPEWDDFAPTVCISDISYRGGGLIKSAPEVCLKESVSARCLSDFVPAGCLSNSAPAGCWDSFSYVNPGKAMSLRSRILSRRLLSESIQSEIHATSVHKPSALINTQTPF